MIIRFIITNIIIWLIFPFGLMAQSSLKDDFRFINFLIKKQNSSDALYLTNQLINASRKDNDSLWFLKGKCWHYQKRNDSAAHYFLKVNSHNLRTESSFHASLNHVYLNKHQYALQILNALTEDSINEPERGLITVGKSAIYLLNRDLKSFDSLSKSFTYQTVLYAKEEQNLIDSRHKISRLKKKSPYLACAMSAVIPGSGKFYAGQKGAGLASFFTCTALGLIAYEGYYRGGIKSPVFIMFGSVFSVFYLGNIYGSWHGTRHRYKSVNQKLNNEILADFHIPVQRLYNE